jgi:hypothetical protein
MSCPYLFNLATVGACDAVRGLDPEDLSLCVRGLYTDGAIRRKKLAGQVAGTYSVSLVNGQVDTLCRGLK